MISFRHYNITKCLAYLPDKVMHRRKSDESPATTFLKNSRWMSRLNPSLKLTEVAMPGAHDAGTYDINCNSPWNPHRTGEASKWAKVAKHVAPCVTVNYSKVQNMDLVDQFRDGARYWDLRVAKYQPDANKPVEYRFTHGLLGGDFIKGVLDLIEYSHNFPKEILILDIRFIFGFDASDHEFLQSTLIEAAGSRLADAINYKPASLLSKYWNDGKNIIIVYCNNDVRNPLLWSNRSLRSVWPNSQDADIAMQFFDDSVKANGDRASDTRLYGLHATLTPDGEYIACNLFGTTQKLAAALNAKLIPAINGPWKGKLNYVMYDVIEYPGLADAIIESNFGPDNIHIEELN